jgi:hypothetical protein
LPFKIKDPPHRPWSTGKSSQETQDHRNCPPARLYRRLFCSFASDRYTNTMREPRTKTAADASIYCLIFALYNFTINYSSRPVIRNRVIKFGLSETELKINFAVLSEINFVLPPRYPKLHVFLSYACFTRSKKLMHYLTLNLVLRVIHKIVVNKLTIIN